MLYRSMSDTNKPFVSVCRKRGNELCYLTRSSSSSSSVNPCSFGDFYLFFVQDFSLSSPLLSRGRTPLVSGKHCLGTCFDSNVKLPWLAPQRRSFSFSSHSHAYLSSLPSQVKSIGGACWFSPGKSGSNELIGDVGGGPLFLF